MDNMIFRRRIRCWRDLLLLVLVVSSAGCTEDLYDEKGFFRDERDNRDYEWVKIGSQTWMAENLSYLPAVSPSAEGSDSIPLCYVFRFEGSNVSEAMGSKYFQTHGVFYNWIAAMDGAESSGKIPSGVRGICPEGWHLPSDEEWDILVNYLFGQIAAGKKMKSRSGWNSFHKVKGNGDNSSGFNGQPYGGRRFEGGFYNPGYHALFWSATQFNAFNAWYRNLGYYYDGVYRYYSSISNGYSVRCIRDF